MEAKQQTQTTSQRPPQDDAKRQAIRNRKRNGQYTGSLLG